MNIGIQLEVLLNDEAELKEVKNISTLSMKIE